MAVPPKGAQVILEAILKTFVGIEYPGVEPTWKEDLSTKTQRQLQLFEKSAGYTT